MSTPKYLQPYENAVGLHGGTFEAMLWRTREGQELRFKAFTDEIDFSEKTILDVGCGIGDFAAFLIRSNIPFRSFLGIDAIDEMVQSANERQLENCTFTTGDVVVDTRLLEQSEWYIFSGTLNAMQQSEAITLIDQAFKACSVGVAFNFLSNQSWRNPESEDLSPASRFDTIELLTHAFTLTPLVSFSQEYLGGHDATIVIRKQEVSQ
jgi:SAM-dependent methyltransferase